MGRVVEFGSLEDLFDRTAHPYTKALLRSVPVLGLADDQQLETIPGITPNPADLKEGCEFANRCPDCSEECRKGKIPAFEISKGHRVRCLQYSNFPEVD
jgi:oligopeptide/dipeptide ABC transporter ATP-binding protein